MLSLMFLSDQILLKLWIKINNLLTSIIIVFQLLLKIEPLIYNLPIKLYNKDGYNFLKFILKIKGKLFYLDTVRFFKEFQVTMHQL